MVHRDVVAIGASTVSHPEFFGTTSVKMRVALSVPLLMLFTGCGLISHGITQHVHFTTAPAGALVTSADGATCSTPCTIILNRKKDTALTIKSDGYEVAIVIVHSLFSKASAGEMLLPGGFAFFGIDILSGGAYDLEPERIAITLKPLSTDPAPSSKDSL
jgi:hypothetical protein